MNSKTFFSLIAAFSFSTAFAATTVEFAFEGTTYVHFKDKKKPTVEVKIDLAKLNATLKKNGLDGLPSKIVANANSKAYYKLLDKRVTAATELVRKLEDDDRKELLFSSMATYYYEFPEMCYRGETAEAVTVLKGMVGGFLTDEQGILAYRYGKEKVIESDVFKSAKSIKEYYEDNRPEDVETWFEYDTKSDDILVMSDLGAQGDGTELYATFVKRCK